MLYSHPAEPYADGYTRSMAPTEDHGVHRDVPPPHVATDEVEQAYVALAPLLRDVSEKKFRIPPADAEAVVNTVFEAYLRRGATVRNLERYLIASVCNASRDYWRARKHLDPLPDDPEQLVEAPDTDTEERLVRSLTISLALTRLGRKCGEALSLHHLGGYSALEIAAKLDTTEQYVWRLLSNCRTRARKMLEALNLRKP